MWSDAGDHPQSSQVVSFSSVVCMWVVFLLCFGRNRDKGHTFKTLDIVEFFSAVITHICTWTSSSNNNNKLSIILNCSVLSSVGDLEGESSAGAKSQRSGEREEDSLHTSSQEKKKEGYSKADKAARSNSVTAAGGKVGGAFNKFRTKYQASGIGQAKSYSSSTCSTQQRSSGGGRRTYVSGSKFLSSGTHAKHISSDEKIGAVSLHKKEKKGGGNCITHWQVEIGSQFLIGMPGANV